MKIPGFRKILLAMLAFFSVGVAAGCSSSEESSDTSGDGDGKDCAQECSGLSPSEQEECFVLCEGEAI